MERYQICLLPGDGIGPEIIAEGCKVLDAVGAKHGMEFEYVTALIGGAAIDACGCALPEETLEAAKAADAVLLAAVGGPKWDTTDPAKPRPEQGLLGIRKGLGLYTNLRPVQIFNALADASTLKPEVIDGVDLMIVRELTGGLYFGARERFYDEEGAGTGGARGQRAYDTLEYSEYEVERIARQAFEIARKRRGKVTSVDKANVLETSRMWREIVHRIHDEEYADVELEDLLVDNTAMQLINRPADFDVMVTENMFGDILSDEAAQITGSLGMLASASLGDGTALYEPSHGSAPDIAGKGIANPLAQIMSVEMMLRYSFDAGEAADDIRRAIVQTLDEGWRTGDIKDAATPADKVVGCAAMGDPDRGAFVAMAMQAPEGTRDLLPDEALFWDRFRATAAEVFGAYGYVPIYTPVMEQTDLFVRGIGEATDVVSKEMFTAISGQNLAKLLEGGTLKAKSRLSLRPEGTAGVVRAVVQHDLVPQGAPPVKLMYAGPMFRAERPQRGRQRQFNQIGIECLGADDPTIDAEGIIMLMRFFERMGLPASGMRLLLNSMGCESCRPAYRDAVRAYMEQHAGELCETCRERMAVNPLRAFDCKNEACAAVMAAAPKITDALCDECSSHYAQVKELLDSAGIAYAEDPTLVRGLDYYTRTVFEVQTNDERAQNALGGGGRYDKLAEEVGGRPTPGFGFALGYERCMLALQETGMEFPKAQKCDLFVAVVDDSLRSAAFRLVQQGRDRGFSCEMDHQHRSLKSQFKLADKLGAARVAVLGPDECANGQCTLRDMGTHTEAVVGLDEVVDELSRALL